MEQMFNFVVCNWWAMVLVVAIFIFPSILGLVFLGIAFKMGFEAPKVGDLSYRYFWQAIRTQTDSSDSWWERLLFHKYSRMTFLVSLFFVWGYIIEIFGWGSGWAVGRCWCLIKTIWHGISAIYKAV